MSLPTPTPPSPLTTAYFAKCSESTADCITKPVRWAAMKPKNTSKRAIDARKKRLLDEICEEKTDSDSNTDSQILI